MYMLSMPKHLQLSPRSRSQCRKRLRLPVPNGVRGSNHMGKTACTGNVTATRQPPGETGHLLWMPAKVEMMRESDRHKRNTKRGETASSRCTAVVSRCARVIRRAGEMLR